MSKFLGEREFLPELTGEKSESSDQFSPQDVFVLTQTATALPSVAPLSARESDIIVDAIFRQTFRRMPAPEEASPFAGMNRVRFYTIFKLSENGKPLIRTKSPGRKKGQKYGACHYSVCDALHYMKGAPVAQEPEEAPET